MQLGKLEQHTARGPGTRMRSTIFRAYVHRAMQAIYLRDRRTIIIYI